MLNRSMGGAVRRETDGRHAHSRLSWAAISAAALVALVAISTLGEAQSPRSEGLQWTRGRSVVVRTPGDTIQKGPDERRPEARDSTAGLDVSAIAGSVKASADAMARWTRPTPTFRSRSDSIASVRTRQAADRSSDLRIVVSLNDRMLWAIMGPDTLLTAPVAVSTDETLQYAGKSWRFETPRGMRTVIAKRENPVWTPPEWHYAEVARENGLKLAAMKPGRTMLSDGNWLEVRNNEVGVVQNGEFALLPTDEEVIFDNTLFIPPIGTVNRRIEGELGHHMLDTGNGFLFHGTPYKATIGTAATHGCIRLRDEDIEWLYDMMPVGTRVYIY
jgi:hypothetical protein